jgi:hypothetical protein
MPMMLPMTKGEAPNAVMRVWMMATPCEYDFARAPKVMERVLESSKYAMPEVYSRIEGEGSRIYFSMLLSVGVLGDRGVRLKTVRPMVLKTPTLSGAGEGPST